MDACYRDTSRHMDAILGDDNSSVAAQRDLTARSREKDMIGRLHTDIMAQGRSLLNGFGLKIGLVRFKHAFNFIADGVDPTFKSVTTHVAVCSQMQAELCCNSGLR